MRFAEASLNVGEMILPDRTMIALFNWEGTEAARSFRLRRKSHIKDCWTEITGYDLGTHEGD